jgi:serine/threonine-protein kinase
VYEAFDPVLDRTIALKTVGAASLSRAERKKYEKRFLSEARAAARLSHPGIVVVHDVGRDRGTGLLYMAMERLEGETIADRIESGRLRDWRETLGIVSRVAEALHHAHEQGVVHRDVKPANIMVLRSGAPKILDFGIARIDAAHLTMPGELFGTPLYMAPEQALGRPADARADVFSLGTVAYTLLTGRAPFAATSVPAILARVAHRSAPPPSELGPDLPRAIDDVLARAMAKAPEDRYPSARMLAEDVEDVRDGRPPRHRASWKPAREGDRTLASAVVDGDVPDLDLVEDEPARSRKPGRLRAWLEGLALLALAAAAALHFRAHPEDLGFWRGLGREGHRRLARLAAPAPPEPALAEPVSSPEPPPTVAAAPTEAPPPAEPSPPEPSPPDPSGAGGAEGADPSTADPLQAPATPPGPMAEAIPLGAGPVVPEPTPAEAAPPVSASLPTEPGPTLVLPASPSEARGEPAAAAAPAGEKAAPSAPEPSRPSPKEPKGRAPGPRATAWLSIGFEHHLASGRLEVWVDGRPVANEALDSRVTRKLLGFELRTGSVQQTLALEPGRHEVRVRVRSGDDVKTARTSATFRAGRTRRLEVKAPRLRGSLTLEWK